MTTDQISLVNETLEARGRISKPFSTEDFASVARFDSCGRPEGKEGVEGQGRAEEG